MTKWNNYDILNISKEREVKDMNLLLVFIILNVVNVILQTIKSLCTVKCGKGVAALVNAIAYGLYTVVIIYTVCDLPLVTKAIVVALCNLIGVYVVKLLEEKAHKDKLWLVKITIPNEKSERVFQELEKNNISYSKISLDKYNVFDCYCNTQIETQIVTDICKINNGKMFATENKLI